MCERPPRILVLAIVHISGGSIPKEFHFSVRLILTTICQLISGPHLHKDGIQCTRDRSQRAARRKVAAPLDGGRNPRKSLQGNLISLTRIVHTNLRPPNGTQKRRGEK